MKFQQAAAVLRDAINEIQRISGLDEVDLSDDTKLLEDIPDFDSLKCVELEVLISGRLGKDVEGVVLPREKGSNPVLTFKEIALRLAGEIER